MKADSYALLGRHNDSIVGLGFQGEVFTRRRPISALGDEGNEAVTESAEIENGLGDTKTAEEAPTASLAAAMRKQHNKRCSADSCLGSTTVDGDGKTAETGGEEDAGLGPVVLSASMDGTVRAWETLGKSEKYRMRHPVGEEVTSMLVLPGGSVLATGETQALELPVYFYHSHYRCSAPATCTPYVP